MFPTLQFQQSPTSFYANNLKHNISQAAKSSGQMLLSVFTVMVRSLSDASNQHSNSNSNRTSNLFE